MPCIVCIYFSSYVINVHLIFLLHRPYFTLNFIVMIKITKNKTAYWKIYNSILLKISNYNINWSSNFKSQNILKIICKNRNNLWIATAIVFKAYGFAGKSHSLFYLYRIYMNEKGKFYNLMGVSLELNHFYVWELNNFKIVNQMWSIS